MQTHKNPGAGLLSGFSLVETLIVIAILAILAGLVFPKFMNVTRESRAKALATNVKMVRDMIEVHRNSGEFAVAPSGCPAQIHAAWFKSGLLPEHAWTGEAMDIELVNDGANAVYPAVKTFDPANPASQDCWYNLDNGHFCARIVDTGDAAETLALFNVANSSEATALGQTNR